LGVEKVTDDVSAGEVSRRLTEHENRCEERLTDIKKDIAGLGGDVKGMRNGAWGLMAGLLAWAAVQLWGGTQARIESLARQPSTQTVFVSPSDSQAPQATAPAPAGLASAAPLLPPTPAPEF
jgi:hypothetical protein